MQVITCIFGHMVAQENLSKIDSAVYQKFICFQVMYMYYLLGYRIVRECQERVLQALEQDKISDLATWADYQQQSGRVGKSQIFNILDDEVLYKVCCYSKFDINLSVIYSICSPFSIVHYSLHHNSE